MTGVQTCALPISLPIFQAVGITLLLTFLAMVIGITLAVTTAIMRQSSNPVQNGIPRHPGIPNPPQPLAHPLFIPPRRPIMQI